MNDPIRRHLARLERQLDAVLTEFTRVQVAGFGTAPGWTPAINAWRCRDRFVICVDLAGVDKRAISVRAEARRLLLSGERPPPEPPGTSPAATQLLAMEIDYGAFERVLPLPLEVVPERVTAEYREGLLWITLPLRREH